MRIAILGCGRVGRIHAAIYASLGHQIRGVADPVETARHELAREYGAEEYDGALEMIEREDLDLLSICSPPAVRLEPTLAAARKGVHIYCEKPMALSLETAKTMWSAVKSSGVSFGMGFKMRFEGAFAATRRLLTEGAIGRPEIVLMSYFQPPPSIAWYVELGVLRNLLVHEIDLAGWFLESWPSTVSANLHNNFSTSGEDRGELILEFARGRAFLTGGYFEGFPSINGRDDICFQVLGSSGYIAGTRRHGLLLVNGQGAQKVPCEQGDGFAAGIAAFLKALAIREEAIPITALDGLRTQAVIEASSESSRSCRPAVVPRPE